MQVFSTFFKIVKKQLPSAMLYLGIFIFISIMMAGQGGGKKDEYKARSCNLVIIDNDKSEASAKLVEYLSGIHNVESDSDYTEEQIQDYLYYQKIDYVLYIEKGYEATGKLTNVKRPGTTTGTYVDNQIAMYERSMKALTGAGYSYDEALSLTLKSLESDGLVSYATANATKPSIYSYYNFMPYVVIMVMFFVITPVLAAFTKKELNDRMNISPMTLKNKNTQIILGTVLFGLAMWVMFIIIACLMGGFNDFKEMLVEVLINTLALVIMAASMSTITGNLGLTGGSRDIVANIVGLGMSFLGGVFVPLELFGKGMATLAKFMPTYWYVKANDKIFGGGSLNDIAPYIGVELLFAVAFFTIAIVISKRMRLARSN